MASLADRMVRAAKLDPTVFEEVESDHNAGGQAAAVVVISSVAAGLSAVSGIGIVGLIFATLAALVGWVVWSFLTYIIGAKLLPEPGTDADIGQMLRTTGFSSAPGVIRVFGGLPGIGMLVLLVANIWMLIAMVMAVRQALDYKSTARAVAVCAIGWLFNLLLLYLVAGRPLYGPQVSL